MKNQYLCQNRIFALIWRFVIVILGAYGLITMFAHAESTQILCYFTMQSNVFAWLLFCVLFVGSLLELIRKGKKGSIFSVNPWVQVGLIYFIQITFLVYATMLSGIGFSMNSSMGIANVLLHYIVPLMALADFVLFFPHGSLKIYYGAIWLSYPLLYVGFSFIRAELGKPFVYGETSSRFPYFFMDADVYGLNLIWICTLFFIGFFAMGVCIILVDKLIFKLINKKTRSI